VLAAAAKLEPAGEGEMQLDAARLAMKPLFARGLYGE
jgi:hypothetical protein